MSAYRDAYQFAQSLIQKSAGIAIDYQRQAELNERFVLGDQFGAAFYRQGQLQVESDLWGADNEEDLPRIVINVLEPLVQTLVSLLVADRLSAKAEAATDEPLDTYRASVAQAVIEFWSREAQTAETIVEIVRLAAMHGSAGGKVIWDAQEQRVTFTPVSIFDYFRDPCPDAEDSRWVVFREYISEEEARDLYEMLGVEGNPSAQQYKNAAGDNLEGVERLEVWQLPCADYPEGLQATIVGGEVLEQMAYPYVVEDDSGKPQHLLPLVEMRFRRVRGSPYAHTPVSAAVPIQRRYNETHASIAKWIERTRNVHLVLPDELADDFDPSVDQLIRYRSAGLKGTPPLISYTQPPSVPRDLYELLDRYERSMMQVLGINEAVIGDGKVRSGVALENARKLDASKNADARRSYETMVLGAYRLALALIGRYYPPDRTMRITGAPIGDVLQFAASDIQGVDVKLEQGSELEHAEQSKEQLAVTRRQYGLLSDQDWRSVLDKPGIGYSKQLAEELINSYLSQPLPDPALLQIDTEALDLDVFAAAVRKRQAQAMAAGDKRTWLDLEKLLRFLRSLSRDQADQMPQQPQPKAKPAPDLQDATKPEPIPDPNVV